MGLPVWGWPASCTTQAEGKSSAGVLVLLPEAVARGCGSPGIAASNPFVLCPMWRATPLQGLASSDSCPSGLRSAEPVTGVPLATSLCTSLTGPGTAARSSGTIRTSLT
jgi:hypothetical protein